MIITFSLHKKEEKRKRVFEEELTRNGRRKIEIEERDFLFKEERIFSFMVVIQRDDFSRFVQSLTPPSLSLSSAFLLDLVVLFLYSVLLSTSS